MSVADQILVWANIGGTLIPVVNGAVTEIAALIAKIRAAAAQHGVEADNASLDAIITDALARQARARHDAGQ